MNTIENRQSVRIQAMKRAQIVFNDGGSSLYCTVRDLSETGAQLTADSWFSCPENVGLKYLEGPERFAAPTDCRIVWRKNDAFGVEFQSA